MTSGSGDKVELHDTIPELLEVEAEGALALGGAKLPSRKQRPARCFLSTPIASRIIGCSCACTSPEATLPRRCSFTNASAAA